MPFLTAGDPDLETTADLIAAMVERGAHMVEIGIPYSDPIADGPVIAESYHRALEKGVRLASIFETISGLRTHRALSAPIVTMVSYSIVHRSGASAYLARAAAAGVDGLIVPDLPVEESENLLTAAETHGLKLIQLVTPTTPRDRAVRIANTSSGFLYYVSVAGINGRTPGAPGRPRGQCQLAPFPDPASNLHRFWHQHT